MPRTFTSTGLTMTLASGEEGSGFTESYGPVSNTFIDAAKIEGTVVHTGAGTTFAATGLGLDRINFIYIENRDDSNKITVTPTDGSGAQTNPFQVAPNGCLYVDIDPSQDVTQVVVLAATAACQVVCIFGEKAQ